MNVNRYPGRGPSAVHMRSELSTVQSVSSSSQRRAVADLPLGRLSSARSHRIGALHPTSSRRSPLSATGQDAMAPGSCRSASWPDNSLGRWGVDFEQAGRADGAPDELAAAVRTDPVQDVLRAVAAPGALVRADKHVRRCRVEVPVAAFAIRPQLQHMTSIDRQPRLEQQASVPVSTAVATSQPGERWSSPR